MDIVTNLASKKKTWLITGVAGFIGSNIASFLINHGQIVVGVDNFITGSKKNLEIFYKNKIKNFKFYQGDITSENFCEKVCKNVEIILHHAALGSVFRSVEDPLKTNLNNVNGFLNMLFYAKKYKISKFIYASSSSVYGDSAFLPKKETILGNVLSPYAATKRFNEIYSDVFKKVYDFDTIGLRYFNVFGKNQNPKGAYAAVIPRWLNAIEKNEAINIYGDGNTSRDFCYIKNVILANILAGLQNKHKIKNKIYNISCGSKLSLNNLFNYMVRFYSRYGFNYKKKVVYLPFRKGDIYHSQADITSARKDLNYMPIYDVKKGLEELIRIRLKILNV
jgi:UDP-N-acetylglucosamine 4-epimerase